MSNFAEMTEMALSPVGVPGELPFDVANPLWDLLPTAIYVCDRSGRIVRHNRRAAELWGRAPKFGDPAERFCGSLRMYRLDGGSLPHAECPMAEVLRTGLSVRDQEVVIERPDGARVVALVNIDVLKDSAGKIAGAVNCFLDITERKRIDGELRKSREELDDFFENAAVAMHWVGPDGIILRANQAELDLLGYARDEYVGRHIAEFHADPATIDDILARLSCAQTLDKYPAKLRAKDGTIKQVQISSNVQFRDGEFVHTRCVTVDVTTQKRFEAALRESERRFGDLLEALPAAVYTTDARGRITYYNQAAIELAGRKPRLGSDEWCVTWKLYQPDGSPMPHDQSSMAIALKEDRPVRGAEAVAERPDGSRVSFIPYPTPLHDESGALIGAVNMLVDITERKSAEERQQLLMNELAHRSRNLLAVVQTIASRSLSGTQSLAEARDALVRRIQALARSQALLVNGAFEGASLTEIIRMELEAFSERVRGVGPDVMLNSRAAQTFALLVHELATNAIKYGALSSLEGRIAIDWSIEHGDAEAKFRFRWTERDGPRVRKPARQGFGRLLVEKAAAQAFSAEPKISFDPEGLAYEIEAPLSAIAGGSTFRRATMSDHSGTPR
jgi:PAS domain S-box-containing protein